MKLSKITINLFLVIFALLISYFSSKPKQAPEQPISQETTKAPRNKTALSESYDNVMAEDKIGRNATAPVDYYMLALSWSPAFCESQREKYHGALPQSSAYQCGGEQAFGWVIHGLWAQNKNARQVSEQPRYCQGDLPALPQTLLEQYLAESPSLTLLQAQWEKHGTCIFKNPENYFAKQKALFQTLTLPATNLPKSELFRWIKQNNPQLAHIYLGASKNELYICYNKMWQPVDCPK